jgi:hypothetical protein
VTLQNAGPVAPTLREAEAAGNTSEADVEQQLLSELAGGDRLPNVPLPNIPLPNIPLPNVPLPETYPDGLVASANMISVRAELLFLSGRAQSEW